VVTRGCRTYIDTLSWEEVGIDGVTVSEFRKNLEGNLETLRLELKRGTYQPKPVRQVLIPKANGKMRALGIPCLRDKIVQEAIRMALEPIFEVEFHEQFVWVQTEPLCSSCRLPMSNTHEQKIYMGYRRRCGSLLR